MIKKMKNRKLCTFGIDLLPPSPSGHILDERPIRNYDLIDKDYCKVMTNFIFGTRLLCSNFDMEHILIRNRKTYSCFLSRRTFVDICHNIVPYH